MLNHLETSTMTRNPNTSSLADTEAIYDLLAEAIDQAGPGKTELSSPSWLCCNRTLLAMCPACSNM